MAFKAINVGLYTWFIENKNTKLNAEAAEDKMIREEEDSGWIIFIYVKRLKGRIKTGSQRMLMVAKQVKWNIRSIWQHIKQINSKAY